jgi:hypothetical protein
MEISLENKVVPRHSSHLTKEALWADVVNAGLVK